MLARVLKTLGWTTAALLLLGIVAAIFGEAAIRAYLQPPSEFRTEDVPAAPDYTKLWSWLSHPDLDDLGDLRPPGVAPPDEPPQVDVFYVHPTTYFGPGNWNAPVVDDDAAAQNLLYVLAGQVSVFSDCCRVFAPRYRQAHLSVFADREKAVISYQALELAYRDVEQAFDIFLEQLEPGRPIILAGHSQGSHHVLRLLETRIQGTPLQQQLVAAYPIGFWVPQRKLEGGLSGIGLCEHPDQLGCFVAYDSYGDRGPGRDPDGNLPYWFTDGWEWATAEKTLCVNPLSWTTTLDKISREHHLGALPLEPVFSLAGLLRNTHTGDSYSALPDTLPDFTSAQCRSDGTLFIESQDDNVFSGGIDERELYHSYDWTLFYMNIRQNVEHRIALHLQQRSTDEQ